MTTTTLFKTLLLLLLTMTGATGVWAATTVAIPTTAGSYIDWNACDLTGANVENSGANIGSTGKSTVATFTISNETLQDYILTFATGSKNAATMQVTLTNSTTSEVVLSKSVEIVNTGSWTPSTTNSFFLSQLPAGTFELKFQVTEASSYAGNWGKLAFYSTESYNQAPGTIGIAAGSYGGGARLENSDTNVGWISNGTSATYSFICSQAGVYKMTIPMTRYGDGTITTIVTDDETGTEEANGVWTMTNPSNYEDTDVPVEGELTTGLKTLAMQFATTSSFLFNYKDFTMTRVGDHYSKVSGVAIAGQTIAAGDDSDWYFQLPAAYDGTTTFSVTAAYGTVAATAEGIDITDNGDGTFTMPTPAPGSTTTVTLMLTPNSGTFSSKTTYTLKLFRIGEISLTDVLVDDQSIDVLSDMNTNLTATYNNIYTAVPTVKVKVVDGTTVTAPAPTISGTLATYAIHVEMAGKEKDYTLVIDGLHIYNKVESDETVNLKYSTEGNDKDNNIWSNGLYTLSPVGDGWSNSGFKMKSNSTNTLTVPSDVVVKQFIIHQFSDNYAPGSFGTLTSDGMTAYIPAKHDFVNGQQYDLIVNLEGHQAGQPLVFTLVNGSQPTGWFELTVEKQAITTAPVLTNQQVTVVRNHAIVALTFDREMQATTATVLNGSAVESSVTAEGGSATLYFPVWGLNYSTNYTLNIAAGAAEDTYGNSNAEAINIAVNTEAKPAVAAAAYDYVVGTAEELKAAISAIDASNTSASATRKVIFLKNGTYDLGNTGKNTVQWVNAHNISLIGESKDGVIICGTSGDISNPVLNIRYGSGQYLQDLTVRNLTDFDRSERVGVSVAVYGGNKAIFKNVAMQAQQDTQVTGERAYYIGCQFYGAVDFICGGGDHFYDQCQFIVTNAGYITAPSTSSASRWGYVMQNCTIDKYVGSYTYEADGNFTLGRPWQNEPRNYWINTRMNVKPSDNGWGGMGTLPTHFYEYNSVDKNGDALDLSVRGNSPSSTNTYTPVLTDAEAQKFTVENVLGGTDSWLPTDYANEVAAPTLSGSGTTLSWTAVDDARCYVIFKDGAYLTNQTATTLASAAPGLYTVRAANEMGGLGDVSNEVFLTATVTTGTLGWATACLTYNAEVPAGTKAYYVSAQDGNVLTLQELTAIPAGEGFIFNAVAGEHEFQKAAATPDAITNLLVGTTAETPVAANSVYVLAPVGSGVGMTTYSGTSIAAGKAYLPKSGSTARQLTFVYGDATGVSSFTAGVPAASTDCYNLSGQRVNRPAKGVYIMNGKKVIR